MALRPCKECGEPVSTSAKSCPRCGAPVVQPGAVIGGLAVLSVVVVAAWLLLRDGEPAPTPTPPRATAPAAALEPPAPAPSAADRAKQPKRKQLLDDLVGQGVFHGYLRADGRTFVVFRIGPAWRDLPLEQKRLVADIAFTYHWVETPKITSALLEDWRTGKTVASFTPTFGLRIED